MSRRSYGEDGLSATGESDVDGARLEDYFEVAGFGGGGEGDVDFDVLEGLRPGVGEVRGEGFDLLGDCGGGHFCGGWGWGWVGGWRLR